MLPENSELKIKGLKKWIREKILNDESMNTCSHYKQKKVYTTYLPSTYYIMKKIHKMKNVKPLI